MLMYESLFFFVFGKNMVKIKLFFFFNKTFMVLLNLNILKPDENPT